MNKMYQSSGNECNVEDVKPNGIKKTCGRCCKIKSSMWGTGQEYLCNSCRTESGQGRGNSLKKYQNKESSLASNLSIDDDDKDVYDCLHQLIMENDVKKVEQSLKEHSEELSTTLRQMEHWLEELLNTINVQLQHNTMQMMYDVIYKALVEVGLENDYESQDYLNFFCLGNREAADSEYNPDGATSLPKNSPQVLSCTNRRFMIYVHLKGMIVDDEYVMLGSANINQRSLDGSRDTEIAMGAYQPRYTWASKSSAPHGQVVIWDVVSKSVIAQFRAHKSPISYLCFDPSGTLLVTSSVKGHNINVFKILGSSGSCDPNTSYIHLFRLHCGFTNAIIQDISFSDDSHWIMVRSSRGTSHLFAINPSEETIDIKSRDGLDVMTRPSSVCWPPNAGSQAVTEMPLCESGPPVTLSVVSRIRSGSNNWRSALSAAAATVSITSMPGAIASAFHNFHGDPHSLKAKYHLLVFSPSGCLMQYALQPCHREEYAALDGDARIVIEATQKWNISEKHSRGERDDIVDVYGDTGSTDISKSCKVVKDGAKKRY